MIVPLEWMPDARLKRIICHWTAGAYKSSNLDRTHYHILVEDDGELVQGVRSIKDNELVDGKTYAAHTLHCNSGSIGVAVCCMAEAVEEPFDLGRFPMTEVQWERMIEVVADLCDRYRIPVTDQTVLGHGEVQRNLGVAQRGKWDPMVLPWRPHLPREKVGSLFRMKVLSGVEAIHRARRTEVDLTASDDTSAVPLLALMNGAALPSAILHNEGAYVKLASLAALGWRITGASLKDVTVVDNKGKEHRLTHLLLGDRELDPRSSPSELLNRLGAEGYVSAIDVARACLLPITYDPGIDTLVIGNATLPIGQAPPTIPRKLTAVVVKPGDTLYKIALRYLGNGNRWTTLTGMDGKPFTQTEAVKLVVGQEILLPDAPQSQRIEIARSAEPKTTGDRIPADVIAGLVDAARPELRKFARQSVPMIVAECLAAAVDDPGQIAYILATADHESNCGMFMRELGRRMYFEKYEFRKSLGNVAQGDGFRYRGRGFVQLTGRANYTRWSQELGLDLVGDPDLVAADPTIAARVLVRGMIKGSFTKRRLGDYVAGKARDFYNARAVINGDKAKNGNRIAAYACRYLAALEPSSLKVTQKAPASVATAGRRGL